MQDIRDTLKVDPNSDDAAVLAGIPGVGDALAKRIVAGRPYQTLEDLCKVNGIGESFLNRIRPYLVLNHTAKDDAQTNDNPENDTYTEEALPVSDELSSPLSEQESPAETSDNDEKQAIDSGKGRDEENGNRSYVTMKQAVGMAFLSGFIVLVLSLVLSLAIIAGLNDGGLQFVSPAAFQTLDTQVRGISARTNALEDNLSGIRERLDNLDALSPRVDAIEQVQEELTADINDALSQVEEISGQVEQIDSSIALLQEQNSQTMDFFAGLKELLAKMSPPEVEK